MKKTPAPLIMLCAVTLLGTGCGEELSQQDAALGWASTQRALSAGSAMAMTPTTSTGGTASSLDFSFVYACPQQGEASFMGAINFESVYGEFTWKVTYSACGVDGVIMDGVLDFELDTLTQDSLYSQHYTYRGELVYSGDVDGLCVVELTSSSTLDTSKTGLDYTTTHSGSVCGHEASGPISQDLAEL